MQGHGTWHKGFDFAKCRSKWGLKFHPLGRWQFKGSNLKMCFVADDFLPDVGESGILLDLGKTSELGLGLDVWPCCFPDECLRKRWCPKNGRFARMYSTWTKMRGIFLIISSPLCIKKWLWLHDFGDAADFPRGSFYPHNPLIPEWTIVRP